MKIKLTPLMVAAIVISVSLIVSPAAYSQPRSRCTAVLIGRDRNSQINVRSGPGVKYTTPHYGLVGDEIIILSGNTDGFTIETDAQGWKWVRVEFPKTGARGWIRRDFIGNFRC